MFFLFHGAPRAEPVAPPLHTLLRPWALKRFACLREAASAKAGCASAKASEGYPPMAKSAEAAILRSVKYLATFCAFIHGHSPRSSAQADKFTTIFAIAFVVVIGRGFLL